MMLGKVNIHMQKNETGLSPDTIYKNQLKIDWRLKHKIWNWCFWTLVLEKTLESPLDCKEIQPVHPKGDQPWVFIGRTDAEAETPILWPPHVKRWLLGKDPDAGRVWGQEEKGMLQDEMVGWHHRLMDMRLSKLPELVKDREVWRAAVHEVSKSRTRLSHWSDWLTETVVRNNIKKKKNLNKFIQICFWIQY